MRVDVAITAHHNGRFEFKICRIQAPADNQTWAQAEKALFTNECLNQVRAWHWAAARSTIYRLLHPCLLRLAAGALALMLPGAFLAMPADWRCTQVRGFTQCCYFSLCSMCWCKPT